MSKRNSTIFLILLCYLEFIILGLPAGFLGAAWPSIQREFSQPLDAVGFILLTNTLGNAIGSFFNGKITTHLGYGRAISLAAGLMAVGFFGTTLAPSFWVIVIVAFIGGLGSGTIDAGLNRFMAARSRAVLINWLHAAFGIGATLGPILMSFLLAGGVSWRSGYLGMLAVQAAVVAVMLVVQGLWSSSQAGSATAEMITPAKKVSLRETLRLPVVWLALFLFAVYAGGEMATGQWAFSLFTLGRGIPETTAGFWTGLYWGSFTIGRLLLGVVVDRFGTARFIRISLLASVLGAVLLWWNPVNEVGFAGLALIGFSYAPFFATMIAYTPRLVGSRQSVNVIGMEVSSANAGIAALPWLAGIIANSAGLETVGPFLVVTNVAMLFLLEALLRFQRGAELNGS